ncbi:YcxB family protein [Bacillus sp. SD088]|uniref:YcxB family protein n=1 Tax=Bacillus sp. SD088 TaxID=2782012 RepID=UPI001A96D3FE|nr:YcxB family protein [Bacillus sp. SD088]MBO0993964.1 YcxB family protein [Bacillus sp. SD088]
MEITYSLTEEEYLKFNLFHVKNSNTVKRALNIQRFLFPVLFIVFSYFFSKVTDMPFLGIFIPFLLISILWVIFYPKYFYRFIIRNTKKLIRERENEGLLGEHRMTLLEEGLVDITPNKETKVTWSGIQGLKEDEQAIYLYNSSVSAYILPKKDLHNVEETKAFIQAKIKDA